MESKKDQYQKAKTILMKYLQEHKLRKTPERFALLEATYSFDMPFDIHDIQKKMEGAKYSTSLSTIYNTFILFEKAYLLLRSKPNGRYSKFIANCNTEARQFLICTECGQVRSAAATRLNSSIQHTKWPRFMAQNYTLYIGGICYSCQKKQEKEKLKQHIKNETR